MAPSRNAVRKCAEWLAACLSFGWKKTDLDFLESLWWKYHNDDGSLASAPDKEKP